MTVTGLADLVLTKQDAADPVLAGTTLIYTLTVTNRGPSPAANVRVTDTLSFGTRFLSGSSCAETALGSGLVVCTSVPGTLGVGASESFTVAVAGIEHAAHSLQFGQPRRGRQQHR